MFTRFLFVTRDDSEVTNDMYEGGANSTRRDFRWLSGHVRGQCPAGSRVDLFAVRYDDEGCTIATDYISTLCQR